MPKFITMSMVLLATLFTVAACGPGGGDGSSSDGAATDSPVENPAPTDDTTTTN